nr:unnamed protein product [Callosobruchus analis]
MFRQVKIHDDDIKYQKILWRNEPTEDIKTYSLTTVTYGMKASQYLAVKALHTLATEHEHMSAAEVIKHDFYVDDVITGAASVEEAKALYEELTVILKAGCFELRKWRSNVPNLFTNEHQLQEEHYVVPHEKLESSKTLGLVWNSIRDCLKFSVTVSTREVTKRSVLSTIAQVYDPLGIVGPVIVTAKLLLQRLWELQLEWDDSLPDIEYNIWATFQKELPLLNNLEISRQITCPEIQEAQLHGFCDASEKAYGACIYLRCTDAHGRHTVNLICSKSRVAPIKAITLPRLELSAALLLAQLLKKIKASLNISVNECHLWSDSSIVLHWVASSSNIWKTFVSNRVAQIQQITEGDLWHHVPTKDNPADIISRGLPPSQLIDSDLWWHGSSWLREDPSRWPNTFPDLQASQTKQLERKVVMVSTTDSTITHKYSSLTKLKRVTAYCIRFIHNTKIPQRGGQAT